MNVQKCVKPKGGSMPAGATLRASIVVIENGLFHAIYRTTDASYDMKQLPIYQVGASVSDVMRQIERTAHSLGYEAIEWDEDLKDLSH
jgi:hypothetical protein